MRRNKKVIGITGGSGAGKSYISELLRDSGYPVIDADKTAHDSINNPLCQKELCDFFSTEILKNGKIDRKKLGEKAFLTPKNTEKLNEITHKYILADIEEKIAKERAGIVFVDGATLIESKMELDGIFAVLSDRNIRKNRIMERDSLTSEQADMRINAQKSDEFYITNCDFTVENNGGNIEIKEIIKKVSE